MKSQDRSPASTPPPRCCCPMGCHRHTGKPRQPGQKTAGPRARPGGPESSVLNSCDRWTWGSPAGPRPWGPCSHGLGLEVQQTCTLTLLRRPLLSYSSGWDRENQDGGDTRKRQVPPLAKQGTVLTLNLSAGPLGLVLLSFP